MSIRPIKRLSKSKPTLEGAGVHLRRAFGFGSTSDFDPFLLAGQIREFLPPLVAIAGEDAATDLKQKIGAVRGVDLIVGPDATEKLAAESEAELVVNALVGSA